MFQINSYLQYRNTPDGKSRVLTEGRDYLFKSPISLMDFTYETRSNGEPIYTEEGIGFPRIMTEKPYEVANLEDCRPLLTVNIDGIEWTELDIMTNNGEFFGDEIPDDETEYITFLVSDGGYGRLGLTQYNLHCSEFEFYSGLRIDNEYYKKLGSFFDDPAHYSKLLWNCPEEEAWQKVFELLNIKL